MILIPMYLMTSSMYGLMIPNFGNRIVRGKIKMRITGNPHRFQNSLFMNGSPLSHLLHHRPSQNTRGAEDQEHQQQRKGNEIAIGRGQEDRRKDLYKA